MAAVDTTLPSRRRQKATVGLPGQNDVHPPHGLRWWRELGWRHVVTWGGALAFAFIPILYVVSSSLNPTGSLTGSNHLFSAVSFDNYVDLLTDPPVHPYARWFWNTLMIATVTALGTVMIGGRGRVRVLAVPVPRASRRAAVAAARADVPADARVRRDLPAARHAQGRVPGDRSRHAPRPDPRVPRRGRSA